MSYCLHFVLLLQNSVNKTSYKFLLTVEVAGCNVMIVRRHVFDQPAKDDMRTFGNVRKIITCQGDNCKTGCLLNHSYLKETFVLIAIDRSKQQVLDADPKVN